MPYKGFLYQAESSKKARRVVAKVEFHAGKLFPRVGFIVTNLETDSRALVRFFNKRGTAEQWIKEDKQGVRMTRLTWHRFRSHEVRLPLTWLPTIWETCGGDWCCPARGKVVVDQPATAAGQDRRPVDLAREVLLALAGSGHLTTRLFGSMVRRVQALPLPTG